MSDNINIPEKLNPKIITHGESPLLYNNKKKDENTIAEPKSGCNSIKRAGPRNKANVTAMVLVFVTEVLKKLR